MLVFHTKRGGNFRRGPPNEDAECKEGMKKSRFATNVGLHLGTDARQSHSYCERRIGNRTQTFEWYHFK